MFIVAALNVQGAAFTMEFHPDFQKLLLPLWPPMNEDIKWPKSGLSDALYNAIDSTDFMEFAAVVLLIPTS